MTSQMVEFQLKLHAHSSFDDNEIDTLAHTLREDLLELDVESVEHIKSEQHVEGIRAIDMVVLDSFSVNLAANLAASLATPIIITLWNWVRNRTARNNEDQLRIEIRKGTRSFSISSTMSEQEAAEMAHVLIQLFEDRSTDPQNK